MTIETLLRKFH